MSDNLSKLRIVIVGEFPDDTNKINGGVQAVLVALTNELAKREDLELHIVSTNSANNDFETIKNEGFTVHQIKRQRFGGISRYFRDVQSVVELVNRINPVVVHGQGLGLAGYLALRSGRPSVLTIHGILSENARNMPSLKSRFRLWLQSMTTENYCISHAKSVISISSYVSEYYGSRIRAEIQAIANPISGSYFNLERRPEKKRLLFAGKIVPAKGVSELIEAIYSCQDSEVSLYLAGDSPESEYLDRINSRIQELGLIDSVHFLGLLSEPELLEEFQKCAALVLPSHQETAPMVVQQAMAAGVPTIASAVGGVAEQLMNGEAGYLCKPKDVDSLAEAIRTFFKETNESKTVLAREKAQSQFHVQIVADKTIALYRSLSLNQT